MSGGRIDIRTFDGLPSRAAPPENDPVPNPSRLTFEQAQQDRLDLLRKAAKEGWDTLPAAPAAYPEDLSARVGGMAMAVRVRDLALARQGVDIVPDLFGQMAKVGSIEGFRMQGGFRKEYGIKLFGDSHAIPPNASLFVDYGDARNTFIEDKLSSVNGDVANIPPEAFDEESAPKYHEWMQNAWIKRSKDASQMGIESNLLSTAPGGREMAFAQAIKAGKQPRLTYSYYEGGNQLTGTLPNGDPYAVVGRSSLVATQYLLKKDLGVDIDDATAKLLIAKDLGMTVKNVVFVEQPASFHLDMAMALADPGVVWVNDSRAAVQLQFTAEIVKDPSFAESDAMRKHLNQAIERGAFEDKAARELEAAGLKVKRVPGAVYAIGGKTSWPEFTFFNGEMGRNPKGEAYFVTGGGHPWAEAQFLNSIKDSANPLRVYLLDRVASREITSHGGSVGCLTRVTGP